MFTTVRIEGIDDSGRVSVGTGFFFEFSNDSGENITAIITNKHVISGCSLGKLQLHEADISEGHDNQKPSGNFFEVEIEDFENQWILHPSSEVDLAAMPLNVFGRHDSLQDKEIFFITLNECQIPSDSELNDLSAVENISMVGYPIGLWDEINNFPIIRQGVTASHPAVDFNGNSKGVIDIGCFPGSSGSPVLIITEGFSVNIKKKMHMWPVNSIQFLGVLFAGPVMSADGEIVMQNIPTSAEPFCRTDLMIHLGYIVKAKEILAFKEHLRIE